MKKSSAVAGFQKQYVRDQIAKEIHQKIRLATWDDHLPSERWLSEELGVGRDQVHQAILKLRDTKVITLKNRRNWINNANAQQARTVSVVFLTPQRLQEAGRNFLFCIDDLRKKLSKKNIAVHVETSISMSEYSTGKRLKRFIHQRPDSIWILHRATPAVQRWFQSQDLPTIILGTASNKSGFPFIDIDYQAAVRHAIGVMQRAGHSLNRILLLRPNSELEGIRHIEASYRSELEHHESAPVIINYSEENQGLDNKLHSLFGKHANAIEGVISTSARATLYLHGWLTAERGLVTGKDISLICIADHSSLKRLHPSVAYYAMDGHKFANRLHKLISQHLAGERSKCKQANLIIPDYISGGSVCKP